jgi:peptidoglycan/xylan/chitin deacetylase (PgdA/CDA1 family)
MPIRQQDYATLFLYYIGYSRIRNYIYRLKQKPLTRIVAFHDIWPDELVSFKANLNLLRDHTNVVSLDDFFSSRLSIRKINVVITFDDGYRNWIDYAVPVLKQLGLPAAFFISSGFIGLSTKDEADFIGKNLLDTAGSRRVSGGLSEEGVKFIAKQGFTIGGHTKNHRNMSRLEGVSQARNEVLNDKLRLEQLIGKRISYFAYPIGSFRNPSIDLEKILREAGYKGAVTTLSGFNTSLTCPYQLRREIAGVSMPKPVLKARVLGNYDVVRYIKSILFRRAENPS